MTAKILFHLVVSSPVNTQAQQNGSCTLTSPKPGHCEQFYDTLTIEYIYAIRLYELLMLPECIDYLQQVFITAVYNMRLYFLTVLRNWSPILRLEFPGRVMREAVYPTHHVVVRMGD